MAVLNIRLNFRMGVKVVLAADGAHHIVMLGNKGVHLVKIHGVGVDLRMAVADELIGAVAGLAAFAVQQRVGEAGQVAAGDPGLRVHDNGGVQPNVGGALLDEFFSTRRALTLFFSSTPRGP